MTIRLAIIAAYTVAVCVVLGSLLIQGIIVVPDWVLWGILIASGSLIYTKVNHGVTSETISLTMSMILLAILNLTWPEIAMATLLGVGIGNLVLSDSAWYKKVYNTVAISFAAVVTEIIYWQFDGSSTLWSILIAALIFDVVLYTLLVPIWIKIGKQTLRETNRIYWQTSYIVPVSAGAAMIMHQASSHGPLGIYAVVVLLLLIMRPEFTVSKTRHAVN